MSHSFSQVSSRVLPLALIGAIANAPTSVMAQNQTSPINPIVINIDGRVSSPDPAPLLMGGAVFVPLRGVLENLGAKVEYFPTEKRIDISQNNKKYLLRPGIEGATVDAEIVPLAAPKLVGGRAFVPLRSLAELFGYRVAWLRAQNTVAIYTSDTMKPAIVDHRAELRAGGEFGVQIDFLDADDAKIGRLLDAAKESGVGIIKTRFDWSVLQPTRESEFVWSSYDKIVREARLRGLKVVGILGNSTQWASVALSTNPDDWRHSPPKEKEWPAWSNYVKRVVGRYRTDVQAWQVWENPSAQNFRSVPRTYRALARLAVEAARVSDPNAIIHAAEPGGVGLNFVKDLTSNGLTPALDGVQVFPVSQWQPGVPSPAENFLLPYATLRDKLRVSDGKPRDYWVGGVSATVKEAPLTAAAAPVVEATTINATPADLAPTDAPATDVAPESDSAYSALGQADYLVKSFALALASGAGKVFWNALQDETVSGTAASNGKGLLRADGSRRPSFNALKLLSQNVEGKPYAGNLAFSREAIVMLFDDKKSGTLVAWSPQGSATLALSSSGVNSGLPGATFVATRPDSKVLDAAGTEVAPPNGVLKLTTRPIFITNIALESATAAGERQSESGLRLDLVGQSFANANELKATFSENGVEEGIFWRKFSNFGGMAQQFKTFDDRTGLTTQAQRDIFDLKSSKPFIYLDVADDFLFYGGGVPVTVTVDVHRPAPRPGGIINTPSSFRIEYDSPRGYRATPLQEVAEGEGWATYTFTLPDASFSNAEGYDLMINSGGSKRDLTYGSITLRRDPISVAQVNSQ
jgi:hypothetical protein